jgi:phosphatidate cytidylyltransferase
MAALIAGALAAPLAGMWGLLGAATGLVHVIPRAARQGELKDRIHTWWWIALPVSAAIALGPSASILLVAILSFLAFRELHSVVPLRRADRVLLALAYLALPLQYCWVWLRWYAMFSIFVPVYVCTLLTVAAVCIGETRGFIRAISTLQWALLLTVYNLSHLAFLAVLPLKQAAPAGGPGLLLFVLLVVQLNDVAQFIWGRLLGRRRIVPAVSPGKTWAGFCGGVLTSMGLAVLLAPWLTPFAPAAAAGLGALLSVCGFLGDVTVSAVKRDLGLKDSGSCLKGHGGILDRLDSLTLAGPLGFHVIRWFYGS